MEVERWQRVKDIFASACELEGQVREQHVRDAAADDVSLAEEVLSLLRTGPDDTMLRNPLAAAAASAVGDASGGTELFPDRNQTEVSDDGGASFPQRPAHPDPFWFGRKLGNYRILEPLGRGGMGIVYRAYDELLDRFVALKTLQRTRAATLHRFKQEFRTFADLAHPNLVSLYELASDSEHWWFTMELVEGTSFLDYIRGNTADEHRAMCNLDRLRKAFRELAGAVAALHAAEKLHRDLKPSNVLVTPEERVVVLDFGLGVELDDSGVYAASDDQIVGSLAYMSPEQAAGKEVSAASDWYSVGVIFFQALTGRLPFADSLHDICIERSRRDGPSPATICPGVPGDLDALCSELLRRDPADRPDGPTILARLGAHFERAAYENASGSRLREAFFVGRDRELEELREAFHVMRRGRPVLVYIDGQSGAGKTALVQHFLAESGGQRQAVILSGRCHEQESVPFKALDSLVDALVGYLLRLEPAERETLIPADIGALARVFPAMMRIPGVTAAAAVRRSEMESGSSEQGPVELRRRATSALRELLAQLGGRHPLILFIDDLHWGDRDSVNVLTDIMTPPDPPIFLGIGCYRTEDAEGSPFLTALRDLRTQPAVAYEERHITVGQLAPEDTRELTRRILESDAGRAEAVVHEIARESSGQPFLVYELIEQLKAGRDGQSETGRIALNDALWRRIEALPDECRRFLEVVAIAGRPIQQVHACRAAGFVANDGVVVGGLKARRLIRGTPMLAQNCVEVYHDRVRETVLDHLPVSTVQSHHRRLARVFLASGRADHEVMAYHLSRGGLLEAAADHYAQAAAAAANALAFDHAADLYRQALDLKAWPVDQQRALRTSLADVLANAGRGADAAREYLAAALHAGPNEALDLQHRASLELLTSGHVDEGLSCLDPVMRSIGLRIARAPWQALLSLLVRRLQLRLRGTRFRATPQQDVNAAALRRIDIGWSLVIGLSIIDPIRGASFQTRSLLQALDAGEPVRVARALAVEAAHLASSGAVKRAGKILAEAERLAFTLQQPYVGGITELARGTVAYFDGRWADALRHCKSAAATFHERCTGVTWEKDTANAFILWSLAKLGSISELSRISPPLLKEARDRGDLYAIANLSTQIMTLVQLAADDPNSAVKQLHLVMGQWSQNGYHVQHHDALLAFVPLELYVGNPEAAWNRVRAEWASFRWSLLSHVQDLRIEMLQLRSWCALAMALQAGPRSKYLAAAKRDARRLRRERLPWTDALSDYVFGAVAHLEGDDRAAKARLASALAGFDRIEASLQSAVTRWRLADLSAGEEAGRLRRASETWFRGQLVANPSQMVQAYAPGF